MSYYNDYLAHYGIKGMKWGVRRYQRKDGSLTAAGKKRRKAKTKNLVQRGRDYVKDIVAGFKEGFQQGLQDDYVNSGQQYIQSQNAFMNQQVAFSRQSASLSLTGGTNPFMFG